MANKSIWLEKLRRVQMGEEEIPTIWQEEYEERAAILEFDGGLSRLEAEVRARQEILARIANLHKRKN